jgi:multidrug resistance protein MdtO
MVAASTLVMILCMTYQIPYAAYAALFALTISRESVEGTAAAARGLVVGSALGGAYVLVGTMLVVGNDMLQFLWIVVSLFLVFYAISTLSSYSATARFAYLIIITVPLQERHISGQAKVESILWAVGALSLGSIVTLLLEIVFAAFRRADDLTSAITERLASVEELLAYYLEDRAVDAAARSTIERLASVGTSLLRRMVQRANYEPHREEHMAVIVALVGRLVDLAANAAQFTIRVNEGERRRIREIAQDVAEFRSAFESRRVPRRTAPTSAGETPAGPPLLAEVEMTVSLLYETCTGTQSLAAFAPAPPEDRARATPFVPGALSNPEHVKFALRGCLAASLSYIIYTGLFWPEISTSVTTCLLTALTTVGASHQKQLLRFAGAIIGGFVIGMGAQVFILPSLDSIGAFTVLFAIVAAIAAWFATASPRLSYFGVQIAVAFYLINLQEFKFQTSLAVARDRVVGILLGLLMMWLAFDQFWNAPAGVQMKETFVASLRLLAQLGREPVSRDLKVAIERSYSLREIINAQFDKVRSLADGVLFEFGPSRQRDLELRDRIRRWQPQFRTLFVIRITSLKYRLQLPGFELPERVRLQQRAYDDHSAQMLEEMAGRIAGNAPHAENGIEESHELLNRTVEEIQREEPAQLPPARAASFIALIRRIDDLTTSLASEIAVEFDTPPGSSQLRPA